MTKTRYWLKAISITLDICFLLWLGTCFARWEFIDIFKLFDFSEYTVKERTFIAVISILWYLALWFTSQFYVKKNPDDITD